MSLLFLENTSWRESGRSVKVGPFDGRLMLPAILFLLFPSYILFYIFIATLLFFYGLQYMGYTLPNAIRKAQLVLSGKTKSGVHYWRKRKL